MIDRTVGLLFRPLAGRLPPALVAELAARAAHFRARIFLIGRETGYPIEQTLFTQTVDPRVDGYFVIRAEGEEALPALKVLDEFLRSQIGIGTVRFSFDQEVVLSGGKINDKVAIGTALVVNGVVDLADFTETDLGLEAASREITIDEVVREKIDALVAACDQMQSNLETDQSDISQMLGLLLLEIKAKVIEIMEEEKISAKGAVERFLALPANIRLRDSGDEKFASIYQDVKQLCVRMLAIKYGKTINLETAIENAGQGSLILVVRELSPADLPILNDRRVIGVVREGGSSKDHVSLRMIDREKAGLVGVKGVVGQIVNGVPLIIDGREELLIVNPTDEKLDLYQRLIVEKRAISERLRALRGVHVHLLECTTSILMMGNVVTAEEVASTVAHQMDGIGLVRTEFFFINNPVDDSVRKAEPEIAEQIDYYQNIIAAANGQEVTFRTIDPDVDKSFPYFEELNGQLDPTSKKGIQLCLDRNSPYHFVFCNQIRALLQTQGRFRVMFPLVQSAADCRQVQALIEEIRRELESAGQPTNQGIVFGMMVEHPRVLSVLPEIFKHKFIRFVSIGTNDLTHFLTATSRYSTTTARYFDELDPRVIRAINTTITQAVNHGIDVSLCGAMGNDWRGLLVLLAMGLEKISFSTGFADLARKIILSVDKPTLEQMLVQIRKIKTAAEIRHYIGDFTREQIRSGQWCGLKEIEPLLFT